MSFFDDLISGFTGQSATPQQTIIPTSDLLAQSNAALTGQIAPGLLAFNKALAPGLTDVQLGVANQIDPSILANFRGANASILDQLNMGESLSPELTADITRKLFESGAATGFGSSPSGRGQVILQTGLEGERRGQQRRAAALGAGTSGLGVSQSFYNPQAYSGLGAQFQSGLAQQIQGEQAARDEYANMAEDIRLQNFSSLINTGGRILGTAAGAAFGVPGIGGAIGGSLFSGSRVGQKSNPSQGLGILAGLLGNSGQGGQFVPGVGGRPDAVTAGSVPFGGAFMGAGPG